MIKDYINEKVDQIGEIEEEEQILEIVKGVRENFNVQCDYFYAGGFDSPGYDIDCFVIAFVDNEGKLQGESVTIETM